ncbi:hypothetical protein [Lewinella sp. JB7]|uniref:hypothetical protein n=1 Tax=Lewinella sp. JB7 TaxID=2962887 RepID=UPI0020C949CE|nr:hypothetical protein [Lewinella sp. JB7]MCP9237187.1 hypothetical protein [Lewinella sp. JB7]
MIQLHPTDFLVLCILALEGAHQFPDLCAWFGDAHRGTLYEGVPRLRKAGFIYCQHRTARYDVTAAGRELFNHRRERIKLIPV